MKLAGVSFTSQDLESVIIEEPVEVNNIIIDNYINISISPSKLIWVISVAKLSFVLINSVKKNLNYCSYKCPKRIQIVSLNYSLKN